MAEINKFRWSTLLFWNLTFLFSLHCLLTLWISGVNKPFPSAPQSQVVITFLTLVSFALCISYSGVVFHIFPSFPSLSRPTCLMWMRKREKIHCGVGMQDSSYPACSVGQLSCTCADTPEHSMTLWWFKNFELSKLNMCVLMYSSKLDMLGFYIKKRFLEI